MEREASDVCLGSCPFDSVSAGRLLLVFYYFFIFLRGSVCLLAVRSFESLMWSVRLICCGARAYDSARRFTSKGVNVQAYGEDELSASDGVSQTGRVERLLSET